MDWKRKGMLRGHGVVVGASIRVACMLALFLEESARLQAEAMRLGTPLFVERNEAEKIAKRTFTPSSSNGLGTTLPPNAPIETLAAGPPR
jgi:ribulose-5-phosphate 4-epimerase/fuculose-1-phosphate aldolase